MAGGDARSCGLLCSRFVFGTIVQNKPLFLLFNLDEAEQTLSVLCKIELWTNKWAETFRFRNSCKSKKLFPEAESV